MLNCMTLLASAKCLYKLALDIGATEVVVLEEQKH